MPLPLAAAVAGGGALLNFAGGLFSGSRNLKATRETNEANKAIARSQMRFQERMSNTAHQREQTDLAKAGLNPILSATGGAGASAPAGSSTTMQTPDHSYVGKSLEAGISSALHFAEVQSTLKAQNAQTAKTAAETLNTIEQGKAISAAIEGQEISNAKQKGILVPEITRAKYEAARSQIAKQREDAEGRYKALRAKEDEKNVWWDKKSEQVGEFLDNVTSGLNVFKMFTKPKPKPERGGSGPRERTFPGAARKAGSTP